MNTKFKIKLYTLLLANITLLMALNAVILHGGVFRLAKAHIDEAKTDFRFAAPESTASELGENLSVVSFFITSKNDSGIYRQGEEIEVSCEIKNTGRQSANNFRSLIRTSTKEVTSENSNSLKPDETITLRGTISIEEIGLVIIACRADVDKKIEEQSESDNREIRAMYVGAGT